MQLITFKPLQLFSRDMANDANSPLSLQSGLLKPVPAADSAQQAGFTVQQASQVPFLVLRGEKTSQSRITSSRKGCKAEVHQKTDVGKNQQHYLGQFSHSGSKERECNCYFFFKTIYTSPSSSSRQ